jgi:hypothetical protein
LKSVVSEQAFFPELLKDFRFGPFEEAAMGRRRRTDTGGVQSVPLTTGAQHEENGIHGRSIIHPLAMASQRMRRLMDGK